MKDIVIISILVITLALSSYFDLRERRIPNKLTLPAILLGLISNSIFSGFKGFQFSLIGLALGIAVFFIPFALRAFGAGDVKLMGAVGALVGWQITANAIFYTAVIGGIMAVGFTIYNIFNKIKTTKTDDQNKFKRIKYIPYGVAISIGTLISISNLFPELF